MSRRRNKREKQIEKARQKVIRTGERKDLNDWLKMKMDRINHYLLKIGNVCENPELLEKKNEQ